MSANGVQSQLMATLQYVKSKSKAKAASKLIAETKTAHNNKKDTHNARKDTRDRKSLSRKRKASSKYVGNDRVKTRRQKVLDREAARARCAKGNRVKKYKGKAGSLFEEAKHNRRNRDYFERNLELIQYEREQAADHQPLIKQVLTGEKPVDSDDDDLF